MDKVLGSVILDHDKELEKLEKELSQAEQGLRKGSSIQKKKLCNQRGILLVRLGLPQLKLNEIRNEQGINHHNRIL